MQLKYLYNFHQSLFRYIYALNQECKILQLCLWILIMKKQKFGKILMQFSFKGFILLFKF